ncbi:MAG TPA: hypothetical protein VEB67_02585, partial [Nitrososphaerales archaeon]|nr:hypothetical protein [Nitrososphaerales archaeon]
YDLLHDNTTIYALDAGTGRPDWSYAIAGVPYRGWLTSTGGLVFASTLSGDILALDQATGALVGETKVGTPLYEGVTVGSDASGNVLVFQLTSEPSYGAFTNAVPGALLALSPGGQTVDYLPWVLTAAAAGVATVVLAWLFIGRTRRTAKA